MNEEQRTAYQSDGLPQEAVESRTQPVPVPVCEKCGAVPAFEDWAKHGAAFKCGECGNKIKLKGAGYSEVYLDAAARQRLVDGGQMPPETADAHVEKEKRKTTVDPETGEARHRLGFWVSADQFGVIHLAMRVALHMLGVVDEKKQKKMLGAALESICGDFLGGVSKEDVPPEAWKDVDEFQNRPGRDDEVHELRKAAGYDAGEEGAADGGEAAETDGVADVPPDGDGGEGCVQ